MTPLFKKNIDMWANTDGLAFYRNTPPPQSSNIIVEDLKLEAGKGKMQATEDGPGKLG